MSHIESALKGAVVHLYLGNGDETRIEDGGNRA